MVDYQKLYTLLFNSITDAIEILQKAQIEAEEIYISTPNEKDEVK